MVSFLNLKIVEERNISLVEGSFDGVEGYVLKPFNVKSVKVVERLTLNT